MIPAVKEYNCWRDNVDFCFQSGYQIFLVLIQSFSFFVVKYQNSWNSGNGYMDFWKWTEAFSFGDILTIYVCWVVSLQSVANLNFINMPYFWTLIHVLSTCKFYHSQGD